MKFKMPFKRSVLLRNTGTRSSHYACFTCRKHFAKPLSQQVVRDASGKVAAHASRGFDSGVAMFPCPQCGQPMTHMGHNFRPPLQTDEEAWEVVHRLANSGYRHNGSSGVVYPTKLRDVPAFIEKYRQKSEGEQLLDQWKDKP